jgi:hypothetical protein
METDQRVQYVSYVKVNGGTRTMDDENGSVLIFHVYQYGSLDQSVHAFGLASFLAGCAHKKSTSI